MSGDNTRGLLLALSDHSSTLNILPDGGELPWINTTTTTGKRTAPVGPSEQLLPQKFVYAGKSRAESCWGWCVRGLPPHTPHRSTLWNIIYPNSCSPKNDGVCFLWWQFNRLTEAFFMFLSSSLHHLHKTFSECLKNIQHKFKWIINLISINLSTTVTWISLFNTVL